MVPDATTVGIDIPIGLLAAGCRTADVEAKKLLGKRGSSVFLTPVRSALQAATHAEASRISRDATGGGISQQAFGLSAKILEVDAWLGSAARPWCTVCTVCEVHPEVSFAEMLGHPASASKKTWQGMVERRAALTAAGILLDDVDQTVGARVGTDDMLDAAAVAWSAQRLADGTARSIPEHPQVSDNGRPIAIWV